MKGCGITLIYLLFTLVALYIDKDYKYKIDCFMHYTIYELATTRWTKWENMGDTKIFMLYK